jgi:hypothetical protein
MLWTKLAVRGCYAPCPQLAAGTYPHGTPAGDCADFDGALRRLSKILRLERCASVPVREGVGANV